MNTKSVSQLLMLIVAVTTGAYVAPAMAASSTAQVSVNVVRHLSVENKADMSFGDISIGSQAGTVTLSHQGTRQTTGSVLLESTGSGSGAAFIAKGEPNTAFSISLPQSVTMTDSDGNKIITSDFVSDSGNMGSFDATGTREIKVGATLNVASNQNLGAYAGIMTVTVNYN